jgi:hypothetical protein
MTKYRSDFASAGFRRSEIIPFLRDHGIDVALALEDRQNTASNVLQQSESAAESALPDWRELVAHWNTLSATDCADIMLGLNPAADRGYGFYDKNEGFDTWRRTIENACESGAVSAKKQGDDWRITPAALTAWCERYGFVCPLRIPRDTSRAVKDEAERKHLQNEVERLQAELLEVANRSDENGREADQLRARVVALEAQAPQYLNPAHDHYSPRLAAAVRAWEAVGGRVINGIVKQALSEWLTQHAGEFGKLSAEAIKQCAYVANWKTTGGRAKGTADESD